MTVGQCILPVDFCDTVNLGSPGDVLVVGVRAGVACGHMASAGGATSDGGAAIETQDILGRHHNDERRDIDGRQLISARILENSIDRFHCIGTYSVLLMAHVCFGMMSLP